MWHCVTRELTETTETLERGVAEKEGLDFTCWWETKSHCTWTPPGSLLSALFLSFQSQVRRREGVRAEVCWAVGHRRERDLAWMPVQTPSQSCPTTGPAREPPRPPRLRDTMQPLQPWDPWRVLVTSTHLLKRHFDGCLFLAFMDFCPSPKNVIIQILLKILLALKIPFHNFFMLKKWTQRTNQEGSPLTAIYPFPLASFLNTIIRRKNCCNGFLPIKIKWENKSKNLRTCFMHLKFTHIIFMPCLAGSRQKWHLFETHRCFSILTLRLNIFVRWGHAVIRILPWR